MRTLNKKYAHKCSRVLVPKNISVHVFMLYKKCKCMRVNELSKREHFFL